MSENICFKNIEAKFKEYVPTSSRVSECQVERLLKDYGTENSGPHSESCLGESKIAIIVPLRNRDSHLAAFLYHYHRIFKKQKLCYQIFAVVQTAHGHFNRGKLCNIGFVEASKHGFDCFIFHDVDELLLNPHLKYGCEKSPTHFMTSRSKES
ncbi:Beta-1,4-galactosyltransferase 1 [Thelohanellus kitauei]|uniref:Beta-1,4-galactosyltransferase 1 n=1 Tax=Thelohanellus kitauei TaxID=669202 RepID=A0A0C2JZN4_THEKT|nr:Beta-1,4-galactosyltransferase 1 [Thelohanellus kitauei]